MRCIYSLLLFSIINYSTKAQSQNFKYDRVGNFKEGMAPVYIGKFLGFIDKTGKEIVPVIYEEDYKADEFTDGVAIVTKNGLSGLVDKTGKLIVPHEYKHIGQFSEGIAEAYKADGKTGFINAQGKTVIPFEYNILSLLGGAKCVNGMVPVKDGKKGYIDKTGKVIVPFEYEAVYNFSDGIGLVERVFNGKVSYVNTKGKIVIPEKYDDGTIFIDGLAYVNIGAKAKSLYSGLEGGKWGVIDKTGKEIIPVIYDHIDEIKNGLTIVAMGKYPNEKKGLIARDGKIILPIEYYDIKIMKDRVVANKVFTGPYSLFDYTGKQIGDFTWYLYDIFPEITDGLLRVQELKNNRYGKVGAIDANGGLKIPFMYDGMTPFEEGLSTVSINKKYGAIDKTGKIVIPLQYEGMASFSEGWAPVSQNGKSGFINKAGKLMGFSKSITPQTANEQKVEEAVTYQIKEKLFDFFMVAKDVLPAGIEGEKTGGKIGILTKEEKMIIPLKYDWISIDTANKVFYVYDGWKVFYGNNKLRFDSSMSGKIGIFDYAGREKFPFILKGITRQKNKYLIVEDAATSKSGVLNEKIKQVIPFKYDLIYNFTDSIMAAKKNGRFGIINLNNETLIPFEYDSVYTGGRKAPGGYQLKKGNSSIWVDVKGIIIQSTPATNAGKSKTGSNSNNEQLSILVDENFDNNNNNWAEWTNEGSAAQLLNGNYRVTIKDNKNYSCWLRSVPDIADQSRDFAIETKIFLHSTDAGNINDSYWLLWGVGNNGKDFYTLGIYPSGKFQYGKQVNGQWDGKAGSITSTAVNPGVNKANVLRVEKRKNEIFFFVNGIEVHKAKYETFDKNYTGVGFQWNSKKLLDIDYLKILRGL
jgi:hypothetical protein